MEFANHWDAVFNPQLGDRYFDRADRIHFDPRASGFSAGNAWWLAELSRWVYNVDPGPGAARGRQREHLRRAGLGERAFLSRGGTHVALVEAPDSPAMPRFRALVFRGSSEPRNWVTNLLAIPTSSHAHLGYERALDRIWPEMTPLVAAAGPPLFLTGHSMGGALATLAALRLGRGSAYAFGAPGSVTRNPPVAHGGAGIWQIVNYRDLAPALARNSRFAHVGQLIYISHDGELWRDPPTLRIREDRRRGPRRLAARRGIPIPEPVSDHAPINYVAHLERCAT